MSRKLFALCLCLSLLMSGVIAQQPTPTPTPAPEPPKTQEERKQAEKEKKEDKWDMESDHRPSTSVEFDTDEGTWMSWTFRPTAANRIRSAW